MKSHEWKLGRKHEKKTDGKSHLEARYGLSERIGVNTSKGGEKPYTGQMVAKLDHSIAVCGSE